MSDKTFTSAAFRAEARRLAKKPSSAMDAARTTLKASLGDGPCLVLGSAPNPRQPADAATKVVCVNASPVIAHDWGVIPSVTVLTGLSTAAHKPSTQDHLDRLQGLSAKLTVFVEVRQEWRDAKKVLDSIGFNYGEVLVITPAERAAIIRNVCGHAWGEGVRDARVSNGVFAAVLAVWAQAERVSMTGFSLGGGYHYTSQPAGRGHVYADTACLRSLTDRNLVDLVDPQFAEELQHARVMHPLVAQRLRTAKAIAGRVRRKVKPGTSE